MATFVSNVHQCSPMPPRRNFHPLPQLPLPNASPAFLATQPTPLRRRREESTVSPPRKFFAASTRKVVRKPQSLPKTEIPLQLPRQLDASLNQLMTSWDLTSNRIFRASEKAALVFVLFSHLEINQFYSELRSSGTPS